MRFAQSQVAEQLAADVHPDAVGRGIAEQIGLACRISPATAARRLNTAQALWFELPDTYAQLSLRELSERVAEAVVSETRHLDRENAATSTSNSKLPASPGWDSRSLPHAPARPPTRPIHTATLNAAVPNATPPGRCPTRTRHHGGADRLPPRGTRHRLLHSITATRWTPPSPPEMDARGTRSWPTLSSNE